VDASLEDGSVGIGVGPRFSAQPAAAAGGGSASSSGGAGSATGGKLPRRLEKISNGWFFTGPYKPGALAFGHHHAQFAPEQN